jgi:hypothetical protein
MHERSNNAMKIEHGKPTRAELITRWTARGLTWAVMGFWLWFLVASFIYEYANAGWSGSKIHVFQGLVFIGLLVLTFFFELAAGVVCIILAGVSFYFWGRHFPATALLMSLPMLLFGVLYIVAWALGRRRLREQV